MVIANPPFSIPGCNNLHLRTIDSVLKSGKLADGWRISTVQPVSWLLRNVNVCTNRGDYKDFEGLRSKIRSIKFCSKTESSKIFDIDIRGALGIYTLDDSAHDSDKIISDFRDTHGNIDDTGMLERVVLPCGDGRIPSFGDVITKYTGTEKYYVKWSPIHGHIDKPDMYDVMSPKREVTRCNATKSSKVIVFDTDEAAENFRHSVVDGIFYKYISWCYKVDIVLNKNRYPWMGDAVNPRTGIKGYKGEWTDDDLFGYFGISRERAAKNMCKM